jgi:hypothetical protein
LKCPYCRENNSFLSKVFFKYDHGGLRLPCKFCGHNLVDENKGTRHFVCTALLVLISSVDETVFYDEFITIGSKSLIVFLYFIFALPIKRR